MIRETMTREYPKQRKQRHQTIRGYKREKISILNQLGFHVDKSIFANATNEIQVDNIARSLILR